VIEERWERWWYEMSENKLTITHSVVGRTWPAHDEDDVCAASVATSQLPLLVVVSWRNIIIHNCSTAAAAAALKPH